MGTYVHNTMRSPNDDTIAIVSIEQDTDMCDDCSNRIDDDSGAASRRVRHHVTIGG